MILKFLMTSIIITITISSTLFAQTVTYVKYTDGRADVKAGLISTNTYNQMIAENAPGSATTPNKVYIATNSSGAEEDQVIFAAPKNSSIPDYNNLANSVVRVSLEAYKSDSNEYYLYAAVKSNGGTIWEVLEASPYSKLVTNDSTVSYTYDINMKDLMDVTTASPSATNEEIIINTFFFLSHELYGENTGVTQSTYGSRAAYYDFYFSSKEPTQTLNLKELKRGDGQLKAIFDNGDKITEMDTNEAYKTLAIKRGNSGEQGGSDFYQNVIGIAGAKILMEVDPLRSGELEIKGLQNRSEADAIAGADNLYNVSLAMENKYQFVSPLSNSKEKSPEKIEVLLEKQACFIMTAGFGEEHYVVDYFRHFRDQYLLTNLPGQRLVQLYYAYSPEYAKKIYQNENARWIVRVAAYSIYYFMNYFWMILLIFGLSILGLRKYRLLKIGAQQN